MALMERKGCNMTIVFFRGCNNVFFNEYFGIEIGNTIQIYQKKKKKRKTEINQKKRPTTCGTDQKKSDDILQMKKNRFCRHRSSVLA